MFIFIDNIKSILKLILALENKYLFNSNDDLLKI